MISKFLTSTSMDYKVRMTFKLKDNHFSWSLMLNLLENDTSFVLLALMPLKYSILYIFLKRVGAHFEYQALSE